MKKISVNKSDEVAVIVEKIIDSSDEEIVLNIPRFSHLGESLSNFNLLKREAEALDKKILIESVDDTVIELAEMSGLNAINPFFTKNKRQFSDIVGPKTAKPQRRKLEIENLDEQFLELEASLDRSENRPLKVIRQLPKIRLPKLRFSFPEVGRRFYVSIGTALAVAVLIYTGVKILPRAKVTIAAQTQEWSYNDSVFTDRTAVADAVKMTIPGQIFSQKKNVSLKFPASGKRQVERKAIGTITVYNGYSSDPQPLVVETRFMAPDGKVFRLTKSITVPGAKIAEGKIVPFSIEAAVAADKPGPDYNIGPVKLFTIPGFKGTPKYQAFYGESANSMSGGFIGELSYPTDEDVRKAKAAVQGNLEVNLRSALLAQIPSSFKILDGGTRLKILEQKVDAEAGEDGKFSVFGESQLTIIAFKEDDLKMLLEKRAQRDNGEDFEVRSSGLEYGLARADFDRGMLSFPVNFKAVLAKRIDSEALKAKIAGKSESELKTAVFGLPGLKSANISLWPFWVKRVPEDLNKIEIIVE